MNRKQYETYCIIFIKFIVIRKDLNYFQFDINMQANFNDNDIFYQNKLVLNAVNKDMDI